MAKNELTILRKESGVEVPADTVVLRFNPAWVARRPSGGMYTVAGRSASRIPLLTTGPLTDIEFEFSGQVLTAGDRARLYELARGQQPVSAGGQGWLGTLWLRDEVYGVANGEQTRNLRIPFGSSFTEDGKTRWYYEMPIVLTEVNLDANPRTSTTGKIYWLGDFNCVELPGLS
ncbi:MAG: hypothetical protein AAF773_00780 [Cyanobacteria bacterium P01_D01_bin.115]